MATIPLTLSTFIWFVYVGIVAKFVRARIHSPNGIMGKNSCSSVSLDNDDCTRMRRRDKMSGLWSGPMVYILNRRFERMMVDVETVLFRIPLSHAPFW